MFSFILLRYIDTSANCRATTFRVFEIRIRKTLIRDILQLFSSHSIPSHRNDVQSSKISLDIHKFQSIPN